MLLVVNSLILIASCSSSSKDNKTYEILSKQLEKSTAVIRQKSEVYLRRMDQKTKDPMTAERATIWSNKALAAILVSDSVETYLENIKTKLTTSYVNIDKEELYKKLGIYQQNIAAIDSGFYQEFNKEINSLADAYVKKNIFQENSIYAKKSILSKIQNDFAIIGSNMTEYCYSQIGSGLGGYFIYEPIVSQNATHLKNGETLTVTAGVGTLFNQFRPEVNIDGKEIKMSQNGLFKYDLKVSGTSGKYVIPLKIEFYDWNDTKESKMFFVEYFIDK